MNLVLFTKNKELKSFYQELLPPSLSKEIFEDETAFGQFLKNLTIPTQVILDKDSFNGNLIQFISKNKFHHVICTTSQQDATSAMDLIRVGSILIHPKDLISLDWWWNRSMVSFTKKKIVDISGRSVVFIPSTLSSKIKQFLEASLWKIFFNKKPHLLTLDGADSQAKNTDLLEIFLKTMKKKSSEEMMAVAIKNFTKLSPRSFRQLLAIYRDYENSFETIKLFIYFDSSYENFDRAFDNCSTYLSSQIYRLDLKKLERALQAYSDYQDQEVFYEKLSDQTLIEFVNLAWKSKHHQSLLNKN